MAVRSSWSSTSASASRSRSLFLIGNHASASAQVGGIKLTAAEKHGPRAVRRALRRLPHARRGERRRQGRAEPRHAPAAGVAGAEHDQQRLRAEAAGNNSPQACLGYGTMPAQIVQGKDAAQVVRLRREGGRQGRPAAGAPRAAPSRAATAGPAPATRPHPTLQHPPTGVAPTSATCSTASIRKSIIRPQLRGTMRPSASVVSIASPQHAEFPLRTRHDGRQEAGDPSCWGESRVARSAALSARARQLTP